MRNESLMRRDFLWLAGAGTAAMSFSALSLSRDSEPFFQQKDIFFEGLHGIREYRIPAIVTTNGGTLVVVCDARVEKPGDAPNNIDLVLTRSVDKGKTWEPMKVIVNYPRYQAAAEPCLLMDRKTGHLWLLYDRIWPDLKDFRKDNQTLPEGVNPDSSGRIILLYAIMSEDDGRTWSQPREITSMLTQPGWTAVMAAPGMGTQMRSGRLLAPAYVRKPGPEEDSHIGHSSIVYSDDQGKTWQLSAGVAPRTNECQVVELVDGRLMMNMRNGYGKGRRAVATSEDGGRTWSEMTHDSTLVDPVCQGSFIRYTAQRDGYARNRLLFANAAHEKERVNMTVRLSYDEGETWPVSKQIYPGPSAYSCMTVLQDGTIGLLYENGKNEPYEKLTLARFNLQWLTDGKDQITPPTA